MNWQTIVQDFIQKNTDKIKKATQPLHDHFGVTYFTYHRIDNDGHYTVMVDRPDWAEYYVANELYKMDPFLRCPDNFQTGICCIDEKGTAQIKSLIRKEYQHFFKSTPGMMFIEKQDSYVEFFGFTGSYNSAQLNHLFSHDSFLLKRFIDHFKEELRIPLKEMQLAPNSLPILKGEDYYFNPFPEEKLKESHYEFLCKIGLEEEVKWAKILSKRERECLVYLLNGQSAKETAGLLSLSPRTIEFYFENIKIKLNCHNKGEVFAKATLLNQLDLL